MTHTFAQRLTHALVGQAASLGRSAALSCNGGGGWGAHLACDLALAELSAADATPEGLHALFVDTVPAGKQQVSHHSRP